jgi:hypothetical protein
MPEQRPDPLGAMPNAMKPAKLQVNPVGQQQNMQKVDQQRPRHHRGRRLGWVILLLIVVVLAVQFFNAAKYSALVQVIKEDRIGVNPTGNALDFGDLPKNKSAVRTVSISSGGNTPSYIMIWKFGGISDFVTISKNNFTLAPHSNEKIEFTVNIPNSANYQYYKGNVIIFQIPKIW